jgi:hypothetical protein
MVEVSYHCPYCGAVTAVEREGYLHDKCVTREPLDGWEYAGTTGDFESADGIQFVCLGTGDGETERSEQSPNGRTEGGANDPNPEKDGCGRTYYLSFLRYEDGQELEHRTPNIDRPRFDFRP